MGRRGFTLLELIVATAILGIAVAGLMSGITGSMRNAARLRDSDRIAQVAREQMNELLADYALPRNTIVSGQFDPAILGGMDAGWRAQLSTAEAPDSAAGMLALDRVRLEIWWMQNGARRTLPFEGYRKRFTMDGDFQTGAAK